MKSYKPTDCGGKYFFDQAKASHACGFFEDILYNSRGEKFVLLAWQRQIISDLEGWRRRDNGLRRFKWLYILIGRKNGKSEFAAALSLYLLSAAPKGAELYAVAASQKQANIVFQDRAKTIVANSPELEKRLDVKQYQIRRKDNGVKFESLSGESKGSHGKNLYALVADEIHEMTDAKSRGLWTALTTSRNAWKDSIVCMITTAGYSSQESVWKDQDAKARKCREDEHEDETYYPAIYGLEREEDWQLESNWLKVNPSVPHIFDLETLREEYNRVKGTSEENNFRRYYLCQETQQQQRWLDLEKWDEATGPLRLEDFKGKDVVLGLDTSQIYDLTSVAIMFPDSDRWTLFSKNYIPRKTAEKKQTEDAIPYLDWIKDGYLIATDGVSKGMTVDYKTVVADILAIAKEYKVIGLGYDPAGAVNVVPYLEEAGLNCIPISQRHNDMSGGSKEFERRLTSGELTIQHNPCLRWQAGNVEVVLKDNMIRPVKPNSSGTYGGTAIYKVDGIVAACIAAQTTLLTSSRQESKEEDKPQVLYL